MAAGVRDWMLDELGTAGRENLDPSHARRYDAKEDAKAAAEVELLTSFGLGSESEVVDLGAGTGQFALAAAAVSRHVTAVDVSPVMLERLTRKITERRVTNVDVVTAGFLTYEHTRPAADVVYSRWALHHLPDFWKAVALARMRSIVRPGGVLRLSDIVYSFAPADAEERLEAWCRTVPDVAAGDEWVRSDIVEHIRDEHSTYTWLLEPMIEQCGFALEHVVHSDDGLFAEYIARAI